jgi:hypothetical protein
VGMGSHSQKKIKKYNGLRVGWEKNSRKVAIVVDEEARNLNEKQQN